MSIRKWHFFCVGAACFILGYIGVKYSAPTVSVVMPVYNRTSTVGRAIESVLNQDYKDFEFVIVDDGSTDDTYKILQEYAQKDHRIHLFKHVKNCGIACARNTAQSKARGKYLVIMDSDDASLPGRLSLSVRAMEEHPNLAAISFGMKYLDPAEKNDMAPAQNQYHIYDENGMPPSDLFFYNNFPNASSIIRHQFIKEHHIAYDETLVYGEDYKYWLEIVFAGGVLARSTTTLYAVGRDGQRTSYKGRTVSDTLKIRKWIFQHFFRPKQDDLKWAYTTLEECAIWDKIMAHPEKWKAPFSAESFSDLYKKRCMPEVDPSKKLMLIHPNWNGLVLLSDDGVLSRVVVADKGKYTLKNKILTVKWEKYPTERFELKEDGAYHLIEKKNAKKK